MASSTGKLEVDVELKADPVKVWGGIRNSATIFPKIDPEQYKSIETVEGDGKSVGSITHTKFAEGVPMVTFTKEKIDLVDEANKTLCYSVVDGELLTYFKFFKGKTSVEPKGTGSLVKWSCEFQKASEEVPPPETFKDFAVKTFHKLDDYLLKA